MSLCLTDIACRRSVAASAAHRNREIMPGDRIDDPFVAANPDLY
jgi:hypothetical protein